MKAVLDRHTAAVAEVRKIEAILGGGASTGTGGGSGGGTPPDSGTPGTSDAPPPAESTAPKLDYRQEKLLKDARWYLNELDGRTISSRGTVAMTGNLNWGWGLAPMYQPVQVRRQVTFSPICFPSSWTTRTRWPSIRNCRSAS